MSDPMTPEQIADQVAKDWDGDESVKAVAKRAATIAADQSSARIAELIADNAVMLQWLKELSHLHVFDGYEQDTTEYEVHRYLTTTNPAGSELLERVRKAEEAAADAEASKRFSRDWWAPRFKRLEEQIAVLKSHGETLVREAERKQRNFRLSQAKTTDEVATLWTPFDEMISNWRKASGKGTPCPRCGESDPCACEPATEGKVW